MKTLTITALMLLVAMNFIFGQTQNATTENGKQVILNPDGTWKYTVVNATAESGKQVILNSDGTWKFTEISETPQTKNFPENEIIVYITKSGTKYHTATCTYLKGGGIPKKLSEVKSTYSPCSKCKPDLTVKDGQPSNNNNNPSSNYGTTPTAKQPETHNTENATGTNSTGKTIYTGPKGGQYHYSSSGKKVYEKKK